jgi:hypothetical protein
VIREIADNATQAGFLRPFAKATSVLQKYDPVEMLPHCGKQNQIAQDRDPRGTRRRVQQEGFVPIPRGIPDFPDELEEVQELGQLEAADFIHHAAERHPYPGDLATRPIIVEKHFRGDRLPVPWGRDLADDDDMGNRFQKMIVSSADPSMGAEAEGHPP